MLEGISKNIDLNGNREQIEHLQEGIEARREIPVLGINLFHRINSNKLSLFSTLSLRNVLMKEILKTQLNPAFDVFCHLISKCHHQCFRQKLYGRCLFRL